MFDFGSLAKNSSAEVPATLSELFKQLDRKTTHTSLRPAQLAALAALDDQLTQRDVIMKLSTGSGKTVLGLVYAEMMRRKYKGDPVVYLCPTTQLVEQVVASGQAIGVSVATFPRSGLPFGALSGDAVLACTYDKLFTANSVFESRSIRPSTIIMDDVHAGADRVRKYFTVPVQGKVFDAVRKLLQPLCEQTDAATWAGIAKGDLGSIHFDVKIICIDKDPAAVEHLQRVLEEEGYGEKLRTGAIETLVGEFEAKAEAVIAEVRRRSPRSGRALSPCSTTPPHQNSPQSGPWRIECSWKHNKTARIGQPIKLRRPIRAFPHLVARGRHQSR